jgi:hypothetical protein
VIDYLKWLTTADGVIVFLIGAGAWLLTYPLRKFLRW